MEPEYLDIDNIVSTMEDDDVGFELHTGLSNTELGGMDNILHSNIGFEDSSTPTPKLEMDKDLVALYNKDTTATTKADAPAEDTNDNPSKNNGSEHEVEILRDVLIRKGVVDLEKIAFENEKGEIEYHSFNDLDYETQLDILTSETEAEEDTLNLNESETELISYLRDNNLTLQQILDKQRESILEELGEQVGRIDFDNISDDELYVLEMQSAYDITEEEALASLEVEKQNEDIFKKKIQRLRADYKEAEDNRVNAEIQAEQEQRDQEYQEFGQGLFEVAKTVDHIGGLTLDDNEKGEILDLVLELDSNGASAFSKMFQDKETLFKLAWFALKGDEAFDKLHTHYKEVIEQTRRDTKPAGNSKTEFKFKFSNNKGESKKKADKKDDVFSVDNYV